MSIRVAIFEDSRKFRESLAILIGGTPGLLLAGAFADANSVEEDLRKSRADVVLMDIELPGTTGLDALKIIKERLPHLNVLMQTVFEDDDKVFQSICSGASGYILKNTPPSRILESIVEAHEGGAPMTPLIAKKVLRLLQLQQQIAPPKPPEKLFSLTPREQEVLQLMVQGLSYKMIAAHCQISFETVRSHIRNIYAKLHVATMTEAVAKAIKSGIV